MKQPTYDEAIDWLAWNETVYDYGNKHTFAAMPPMAVMLVAELFGVPQSDVAFEVWALATERGRI